MSSMVCFDRASWAAAMSLALMRKSSGAQLSNFNEYSRAAASPRAATSAMMVSTVARTWASAAAAALSVMPVLR